MWQNPNKVVLLIHYSYYPCVFVLKPGQLLHINKGRLHAFRKMSRSPLEANDCHSAIRTNVIDECAITKDIVCTSVAWDWMYLGKTREGIQEEVAQTLDSVKLAIGNGSKSLAIPQLSIIETAKVHLAKYQVAVRRDGKFREVTANDVMCILGLSNFTLIDVQKKQLSLNILKGIYPGLVQILDEQIGAIRTKIGKQVTLQENPDSYHAISTGE